MPFTYTALWNNLNRNNIGKWDLCQALGLSSSTMAKMTNGKPVSMDVLARICDYLNCGLDGVVEYTSDLELFARRIKKHVLDFSYTTYMDSFPEYRFLLSDYQMKRLQTIEEYTVLSEIREFEKQAVGKHTVKSPIIGTTAYAVQSSGNLLVLKGSLTVIEMLMEWLMDQIGE